MVAPVLHRHPVRGDRADRVGLQRHVRPGQGRVVLVREQHPLAAEAIGRREPGAQGGIGDLPAQVVPARRLGQPREARDPGEAQGRPRLPRPELDPAQGAARDGQAAKEGLEAPADRRSLRGITQGGVRWNRVSCPTSGAMAGTTWIALAPVPITPTRLPRSETPWSHPDVWKSGPRKVFRPGIAGIAGWCSAPCRRPAPALPAGRARSRPATGSASRPRPRR